MTTDVEVLTINALAKAAHGLLMQAHEISERGSGYMNGDLENVLYGVGQIVERTQPASSPSPIFHSRGLLR